MDNETKEIISIILLIFFPIVLFFASFLIGRYPISPIDVVNTILCPIFPQLEVNSTITTIVYEIRLPRILGAIVVGACLAISGAAFQSIFKNPLVSSDLLGVSNGAGFGAALAILLSGANIITQIFAFVFGLISVATTYLISRTYKAGKFIADPDDKLPEIVYWLMGSLASINADKLLMILIPVIIGLVILLLLRWHMNLLAMGDEEAQSLGLNPSRIRLMIIAGCTLLTSAAVSISGIVGWVGLIIPHMARMIVGPDNRVLLPASLSLGASFLLPNGTGKTTLIKCLNGLHEIGSGEILINGENMKKLSFREISRHIGYIPQSHVPSFPFKVFDVVLMGRAPYLNLTDSPKEEDVKIAEDALKTLGIENLKDKEYTNLSGGERQLVFLARVLCQKPDILILDEPTSHLDFGNQIKLLEIIDNLSKSGLAIIMSSHFPDHAFLSSTKVAIMKNKKFIDFGAPDDVVTEDNLKKAYSIDVKLMELDDKRKVCVPMKTNLKLDL